MDPVEICELAIAESKNLEGGLCEICADSVSETKVAFESTDFSVASSSQVSQFGIRSILGGRQGFVTTNILDEKLVREKVRESQQIARLSPENPNYDIADPNEKMGSFEMCDERLENAGPKDILGWAQLLVDECLADKKVALDRAEVSLMTSSRVIHNSRGVKQKVNQTLVSWYVMGMARDGDEVTSFDYDGNQAANIDQVRERIQKTVEEFKTSVVGSLGASHGTSYKGLVLLHPAAVQDLIGGLVSFNVNAKAQQDGMSRWKDLFGREVGNLSLNITEDPTDKSRPATWTPFDREGVPTEKADIISGGILRRVAHNSYTAKRAGVKSSGNAGGGARSVPAISLHGLTVGAGNASAEDLHYALGSGLVIKRFSGNADPISGQFSGIAKNSWWVQGAKRSHPLKEVMVSGNLFEMIKNIRLIGKEQMIHSGSFVSPYILVDGISVTAG